MLLSVMMSFRDFCVGLQVCNLRVVRDKFRNTFFELYFVPKANLEAGVAGKRAAKKLKQAICDGLDHHLTIRDDLGIDLGAGNVTNSLRSLRWLFEFCKIEQPSDKARKGLEQQYSSLLCLTLKLKQGSTAFEYMS